MLNSPTKQLTEENFEAKIYRFRDRQAGVSLVYNPKSELFSYNAYCLETVLVKELFTVEHEYLDDALRMINEEFGSWDLVDMNPESSGCGSCVAK